MSKVIDHQDDTFFLFSTGLTVESIPALIFPLTFGPSMIEIHITGSLVETVSAIMANCLFCTDDISCGIFPAHVKTFWSATFMVSLFY